MTMAGELCPMRGCGWEPRTRSELLAHIASEHVEELQLMVAGASGGQGTPVTVGITQHIDRRQVQDAADLVASVLVPQMRAQLAKKLAKEKLRPVDPWPAVQVRWFCWAERYLETHPDAPGGMRPAREGEEPDLYQLELQTLAVPDRRTFEL